MNFPSSQNIKFASEWFLVLLFIHVEHNISLYSTGSWNIHIHVYGNNCYNTDINNLKNMI